MKRIPVILLLAASAAAALAQTAAKPAPHATAAAKPASAAAKPAATAPKAAVAASPTKLPAGVPPAKGIIKSAFTLRYVDVAIGAGPVVESGQMFKVQYTGYLGSNGRPDDGRKFDSSYDHRMPVTDKDGKPVLGDDGKPKLGESQPLSFPQGYGRLIPGFDQGVAGMKIGGKRRIFIPWQLAYGAHGRPGPDAEHPGIPPMADLIFDVELLEVSTLPTQPNRPSMGGVPPGHPMPPGMMPHPPTSAPATPPPAPADHTTAAPTTAPTTAPATAPAQPAAPQPK